MKSSLDAYLLKGFLVVRIPLGSKDTMIDGPFNVPWADEKTDDQKLAGATSRIVEMKKQEMKTLLESRVENVSEGSKLHKAKDMVFKDVLVMSIVALSVKKEHTHVQVNGNVLNVASSTMIPDGPTTLSGSVEIEKERVFDAKRVTWDLADGYLRVTFPFGTAYTMLQGPFSVAWAPYQDRNIEMPGFKS